jgi:uncharacterized protein YndB with AHSA1/START domain
VNSW